LARRRSSSSFCCLCHRHLRHLRSFPTRRSSDLDVGLKTELASGQLIEFNTYNEMKDNDDKNIEVFFGSWSVGSDPDPSGLWHSTAEWNYGRWVNEESDELLEDGLSEA